MRFTVRTIFPAAAALLAVIAAQTAARAHFIWATVDNSGQVRFALLENVAEAPDARFEKYVADLSVRAGTRPLTLGAAKNGARFATVPAGQGVVLAETIVRAKERPGSEGEPAYLLIYDAKAAVSLAAAGTLTKAPAELVARKEGNQLVIQVRQEGWPVPQGEVWVQWPGQTEPTSVQADIMGEARVPWPAAQQGGIVGIRSRVTEPVSGEANGVKYASIHRWATLTFPIEGPKAVGANK